jgi:hypothetical protein
VQRGKRGREGARFASEEKSDALEVGSGMRGEAQREVGGSRQKKK